MDADQQIPAEQRPPRRRLSLIKKSLFAGITCAGVLVLIELLLAAVGVKPLKETRDPFAGFSPGVPLFVRQGENFVTNQARLVYFNAQSFPAEKSANAYRVFCLGGSTTFGRPYDDRTSYVGWLREMLRAAEPGREWQVINCGGISYASYRLAFLMDELVRYQPDMIIVYTGHNEFLEERTFREVRDGNALVELLAGGMSHTRLATVVDRVVGQRQPGVAEELRFPEEVNAILDSSRGPAAYTRDVPLRHNVARQFRESLDHICLTAGQSGAKVILIKPACNLRDFSPFKSEHGSLERDAVSESDRLIAEGNAALAAKQYDDAALLFSASTRIDAEFAMAHYQAGVALVGAKRFSEARDHFIRARDEDICPLRAPTPIQDIVSQVAHERRLPLIDFPRYLEQRCQARFGHDIVGDEAFLDHVHPTIDVHSELASLILGEMTRQSVLPGQGVAKLKDAASERVLSGLDDEQHGLALCNLAQVLSWAGKDAEALTLAQRAKEKLPTSSYVVSQYGRLLEKTGKLHEAIKEYSEAALLDPNDARNLSWFGGALLATGANEDALALLKLAAKNTPDYAPLAFRISLHTKLARCLTALGRTGEANDELQKAKVLESE